MLEYGFLSQIPGAHGIANLYVAGSSLFPTSGLANSTLTLLALSQRTADAISGRPIARCSKTELAAA
jgi:choline dehydrogenase-like flavoprotein